MLDDSTPKTIQDPLSWDLFSIGAKKRNFQLPSNPTMDNRLIIDTKNFFVVSGLGAFVPGYFLIITKKTYTSFAQLDDNELQEFNWLVKILNESLKIKYNMRAALFEHGMCSCAGGLDHAHVHMMTIPNELNKDNFTSILDKVLKKRAAGINKMKFNNSEFDNIHDISTIINFHNDYEIIDGKLLKSEDIKNFKNNFGEIRSELLKEEQYIQFRVLDESMEFCTKHYLGTQFGREIVYECFFSLNSDCKSLFNQLNRTNPSQLVWRWQDYYFDKNIMITMKDLGDFIRELSIKDELVKEKINLHIK